MAPKIPLSPGPPRRPAGQPTSRFSSRGLPLNQPGPGRQPIDRRTSPNDRFPVLRNQPPSSNLGLDQPPSRQSRFDPEQLGDFALGASNRLISGESETDLPEEETTEDIPRQPSLVQRGAQAAVDEAKSRAAQAALTAGRKALVEGVKKLGLVAAEAAGVELLPIILGVLAVIGVIILVVVIVFAIISFSGGDPQGQGTTAVEQVNPTTSTDLSALESTLAGGIDSAAKAQQLISTVQQLKTQLVQNSGAIAILNDIEAAAQKIIDSPNDTTVRATQNQIITDKVAALKKLLAKAGPNAGTFWDQLINEAVALGSVKDAGGNIVGTPVSQLYDSFTLTHNSCAGSLSRVIARVQKNSDKFSDDEVIVRNNLCLNLFKSLTSGKWAGRVIAGGYRDGRPFGPTIGELINSNSIPRGALVYKIVGPAIGDHVFIFLGVENGRILRANGGGANWVVDSKNSVSSYSQYPAIVVALDSGIWAR